MDPDSQRGRTPLIRNSAVNQVWEAYRENSRNWGQYRRNCMRPEAAGEWPFRLHSGTQVLRRCGRIRHGHERLH